VNADIRDIRVIVIDRPADSNPAGVKRLGKLGVIGVAVVTANAVCHASGTRVRDLPTTIVADRRAQWFDVTSQAKLLSDRFFRKI
jgi:xanthine dehydrogenase YagR molybdenum-binding subunit